MTRPLHAREKTHVGASKSVIACRRCSRSRLRDFSRMASSFTWFANGWTEERPPELRRDFNCDRVHWDVARDVWFMANVKKLLPPREQADERDKAWTRALHARTQKRRRTPSSAAQHGGNVAAPPPADPASADTETPDSKCTKLATSSPVASSSTPAVIREKAVHVARERELTLVRPQLWPRLTVQQHQVAQEQQPMDSEESTARWLLVQRMVHGVETQEAHIELFRGLSAMRVRMLWLGSEIHNALDACGWLALDCLRFEDVAARSGRLDLLQQLHDLGYFKAARRCTDGDTGMCGSDADGEFWHHVAHGLNLPISHWLASLPGCWDFKRAAWLCAHAARAGSIELLTWAHSEFTKLASARANATNMASDPVPMDVLTLARNIWWEAGEGGHVHVLRWACAHSLVPPKEIPGDDRWNNGWLTLAPSAWGHLAALQWLHRNSWPLHPYVCSKAWVNGFESIRDWAIANGAPCDDDIRTKPTQVFPSNRFDWVTDPNENAGWRVASFIEDAHGVSEDVAEAAAKRMLPSVPTLPADMWRQLREFRAKEADPRQRRATHEQEQAEREARIARTAQKAKDDHLDRCLHMRWFKGPNGGGMGDRAIHVHLDPRRDVAVSDLRQMIVAEFNRGGYGHPYDEYTTEISMIQLVVTDSNEPLRDDTLVIMDGSVSQHIRGGFTMITTHPACAQPGCLQHLPRRHDWRGFHLLARQPPWKSTDSCAQPTRKWQMTLRSDCSAKHMCAHGRRLRPQHTCTQAFCTLEPQAKRSMTEYWQRTPRAQFMSAASSSTEEMDDGSDESSSSDEKSGEESSEESSSEDI